jgi:hypothetical protein
MRKTSDGGAFTRALRVNLTAELPYFKPFLENIVKTEMAQALGQPGKDGKIICHCHSDNLCSADGLPSIAGWTQAKIFPLVKHLVSKLNCFVFFGPELCK